MAAFTNIVRANVRIFQTTAPATERWKDWTKQRGIRLYTMDVPSIEEVEDLAYVVSIVAAQSS